MSRWFFALVLVVPTLAYAAPIVVATPSLTPCGLHAWTVAVDWNDSDTAAGYFALTAESTNIVQLPAFGSADVDVVSQAILFDSVDPSYDSLEDSYWLAGPSSQFPNGVPPFNGVLVGSGAVGSNEFSASYISSPMAPVHGVTPILYLVTPDGAIRISGDLARGGVDYPVDVTFTIPEPSCWLLAVVALGTVLTSWRRARP